MISSKAINELCSSKALIEPFNPVNIQPAGYDLTLGEPFLQGDIEDMNCIDVTDPDSINSIYTPMKPDENGNYILYPAQFCLATTQETVNLPNDIVGQISGRSSMARMGLFVHTCAGFIDPGFCGRITLELYNCGSRPILLNKINRICQIYFTKLDEPSFSYNGKYQNQETVTGTRVYLDKDLDNQN